MGLRIDSNRFCQNFAEECLNEILQMKIIEFGVLRDYKKI